jgi:hypothetical protein
MQRGEIMGKRVESAEQCSALRECKRGNRGCFGVRWTAFARITPGGCGSQNRASKERRMNFENQYNRRHHKIIMRKTKSEASWNDLAFEQCETVEKWLFDEKLSYPETAEGEKGARFRGWRRNRAAKCGESAAICG